MEKLQMNALHDSKRMGGALRFTRDGGTHTFNTWVNRQTGDRLTWFDNGSPTIGHTLREIKVIVGNIRSKHQVTDEVGNLPK